MPVLGLEVSTRDVVRLYINNGQMKGVHSQRSAARDFRGQLTKSPHFTDGETKARKSQVIYTWLHDMQVASLGLGSTCWLSIKWAWRREWELHTGVLRNVLMRLYRPLPWMENSRTRGRLWCACPLRTPLPGAAGGRLHLVCKCVWLRGAPGPVGVGRQWRKEVAASLMCANENPFPCSWKRGSWPQRHHRIVLEMFCALDIFSVKAMKWNGGQPEHLIPLQLC